MDFKKLENDANPLFISGLFVLLLIMMIIPTILFSGELIEFIGGEKSVSQDYCKNNVDLKYGIICKEGSKLKLNIENNGNVAIDEFIFNVEEDSGDYLTRVNYNLNTGYSFNYSIEYHLSSEINRIIITPIISSEGESLDCPTNTYEISNLRSCDYSSGGGGDGDNGGSSNGNGNSASCVDSDEDGYGANCALGPDCDDGDETKYALIDLYNDGDEDLYGVGNVIETYCGKDDLSLLIYMQQNDLGKYNTDCDDNNSDIWYLQDFYLDEDHDLYGVGDITHTECWGTRGGYEYPLDEMAFNNDDCDDSDSERWEVVSLYDDLDIDSYGAYDDVPQVGCIGEINENLLNALRTLSKSLNNNDCNDSDNIRWQLYDVYPDNDWDGYGFGDVMEFCSGTMTTFTIDISSSHLAVESDDCNDNNSDINPGEIEVCDDGFDNNCDEDLCVDCYVESPVLSTGCRCGLKTYYSGYCCDYGHSEEICSHPIRGSPLKNFFGGILDYLFST